VVSMESFLPDDQGTWTLEFANIACPHEDSHSGRMKKQMCTTLW
jgi:hypothetical protein